MTASKMRRIVLPTKPTVMLQALALWTTNRQVSSSLPSGCYPQGYPWGEGSLTSRHVPSGHNFLCQLDFSCCFSSVASVFFRDPPTRRTTVYPSLDDRREHLGLRTNSPGLDRIYIRIYIGFLDRFYISFSQSVHSDLGVGNFLREISRLPLINYPTETNPSLLEPSHTLQF